MIFDSASIASYIEELADGDVCQIHHEGKTIGLTKDLLVYNPDHPDYVEDAGFNQILQFRIDLPTKMDELLQSIRDGNDIVFIFGQFSKPFERVTVSYSPDYEVYVSDESSATAACDVIIAELRN